MSKTLCYAQSPCISLPHIDDGPVIVTPAVKDAGFPQMAFNQSKAPSCAISHGRNFHEVIAVTIPSMEQPRELLLNNRLTSCYILNKIQALLMVESFDRKITLVP